MRNLLNELNEGEAMMVPLPKHKLLVSIFAFNILDNGEVEIQMEYDTVWAKKMKYTDEAINQELEEVLLVAMEKHAGDSK